jgi:hypothetical protein
MRRISVATIAVAGIALVAASVGSAGRIQQTLTCGGGLGTVTVTVTNTTNDHSVAWGVGTVSSSLHGIPVSFSGTATDLTTNTPLPDFSFSQAKGNGNGMHNQPTVTCTEAPQTDTAGDLGVPGVDPSDIIEFDFSAQVVLKP